MTWDEEVRAGMHDVLDEFPPTVAAILDHVPVMALETREPFWSNWDGTVIRMFRWAFDEMRPDEDRAKQVRDCLRHEYEHAMGVMHPGHDDMRTTTNGVGVLKLPDGRYAVIPYA